MHRLAAIALVAGLLIGIPAVAQEGGYKAMVEVSRHQISVNRGEGFRQVDGITPVRPGDLVMASEPDGHGWIIYPDCDVEVLPGKVYTVEDRPGVVQVQDAKQVRPICKRALPYWLLAAPIAVGICAAADCFDDDDRRRRPASP
jgi:hypothetical protein